MPNPQDQKINLQLTRTEWLILRIGRDEALRDLHQMTWTDNGDPQVLDGELRNTPHPPSRRSQRETLQNLQTRWDINLAAPATDRARERRDAGFAFARKLLRPSYRHVVTRGRDTDIAIALPDETMDDILTRMAGRCLQSSLIATRNIRLGITTFTLYRTRPRDEAAAA